MALDLTFSENSVRHIIKLLTEALKELDAPHEDELANEIRVEIDDLYWKLDYHKQKAQEYIASIERKKALAKQELAKALAADKKAAENGIEV